MGQYSSKMRTAFFVFCLAYVEAVTKAVYNSAATTTFDSQQQEQQSTSDSFDAIYDDVSDITSLSDPSSMSIASESVMTDDYFSAGSSDELDDDYTGISYELASDSGLDSISFSDVSDVADLSSMLIDAEADFSDDSFQSASDSALLSDVDDAPYSDYSTPGRAYQSASSYLS